MTRVFFWLTVHQEIKDKDEEGVEEENDGQYIHERGKLPRACIEELTRDSEGKEYKKKNDRCK